MRTLQQIIDKLQKPRIDAMPAPAYTGEYDRGVMLAVEDMKRHMTDEGWQIAQGLEHAGYTLTGFNLPIGLTDTRKIIEQLAPGIAVVQDKREWDVIPGDFRETRAKFQHVEELAKYSDIFKLTILKDAQHRPDYHMQSAAEIGCHAWIVYYHPKVVTHVAPYVRPQHIVRTYHSFNRKQIPEFNYKREACLLSGAVSRFYYPLRDRLIRERKLLTDTVYMPHPGYNRHGCATPGYLQTLNRHKVAICTASVYGYALRKIIEATACGCRVVTDLPVDEVLPFIDNNLIRISSESSTPEVDKCVRHAIATYSYEEQLERARLALWYDYRQVGTRLAADINNLRLNYNQGASC